MFIKEPKTFFDSVKPIIYFNCFCGMGVHGQLNLSDTVYFYMRIYLVMANLTNWIMTYIGLTALRETSKFADVSLYNDTITQVIIYTNSCITIISPLLIWLQKKELQDCLQRMPILDETFHRVLGTRKNYRKQYITLVCKVMAVVLVVWVICIFDIPWIMTIRRSMFKNCCIAVTLHYPVIAMLVSDLNFCVFTGYLKKKFQDTNDSLMELAGKPNSTFYTGNKIFVRSQRASKVGQDDRLTNRNIEGSMNDDRYLLCEIRRVHLELCKLSRTINLAFGIQNLISVGISFVMVTGMSYNVYIAISSGYFTTVQMKQVVPSMIWIILYAFKIWVVNHASSAVSKEVQRIGHVIYELLESARADEGLRKEVGCRVDKIIEFGLQMLQNPVQFDACGFFTLDYKFLQGAIGSVTTYLVILIQMSHLSESSTTDTSLLRNSIGNSIINITENYT